jgi:hypothetical protein
MAGGLRAALRVSGPNRTRKIIGRVVLAVGVLLTGLTLLAQAATMRDDYSISKHLGRADADVLNVSFERTVVRYTTPDGTVRVPSVGVIYPLRLVEGDRVRVEYDTANPDLVRVAGRDWKLGLLPVGTSLLGMWVVVGGTAYGLLRRKRGAHPE